MAETEYLTVGKLSTRDLRRIFSRIVVTPGGCWEWQGELTDRGGYGRLRYRYRYELTHRFMYAWLVGPLPRGIGRSIPQLDHRTCAHRPCCNPNHLMLVTARENAVRTKRNPIVDNARKTHCVRGHRLPDSPNAQHGMRIKRYCVECSRLTSALRRDNNDYVEYMKDYLRHYHHDRKNGPFREDLLRRGREASQRYRVKARLTAAAAPNTIAARER